MKISLFFFFRRIWTKSNTLVAMFLNRQIHLKSTEGNLKNKLPSSASASTSTLSSTRLISIESQPKKIVVKVVVVIGVGVVVVHVVDVVIPVVDTRNIPNKVWLKPGY